VTGPVGRGPFVGREPELRRLRSALDAAAAGQGGLALVTGEPGIGKTRLVQELAAYARQQGTWVLWGRCAEDAGAPAYWPWVQLVRGYVRAHEPHLLAAELGVGAAVVAQLVPELRELLPDLPEPPPLAPAPARFRLFDAVTGFLQRAAARQPLVLLFDDLHAADAPSLLLLRFLARGLDAFRILVVGTARDVDLTQHHALAQTLAALTREPDGAHLRLRGLSREDVGRFIERLTGRASSEPLVATVHERTDGNPFFVTEVVRLLAAEDPPDAPRGADRVLAVPESVRAAVRGRRPGAGRRPAARAGPRGAGRGRSGAGGSGRAGRARPLRLRPRARAPGPLRAGPDRPPGAGAPPRRRSARSPVGR
jgi:predicted ATPase